MTAPGATPAGTALEASAEAIAGILKSQALDEAWRRHYRSQKDKNPAHEVASRILKNPDSIKNDPSLYVIARDVTALAYNGLSAPPKDESPEIAQLRKHLGAAADYIENLRSQEEKSKGIQRELRKDARAIRGINKAFNKANTEDPEFMAMKTAASQEAERLAGKIIPKRHELPEEHQRILKVLEHETAQGSFSPIKSSYMFVKDMWTHIAEDMKKRPKTFTTALTASAGLLGFIHTKGGLSSTIYIDSRVTGIEDLSFESLLSGEKLKINPDLVNYDLAGTCHQHTQAYFGDAVANSLPSWLSSAHCGKYMTMAEDLQGSLHSFYSFCTERLAWFTGDRAMEIAAQLPHNAFTDGFIWGSSHGSLFFYNFDFLENWTVHSVLAVGSAVFVHKNLTLNTEEAREQRDKVRDIFYRAVRVKPMNYALSAAATFAAYQQGGGFNTKMIWAGAGAAMVGAGGHKLINWMKRKDSTVKLSEEAASEFRELDQAIVMEEIAPAVKKISAPETASERSRLQRVFDFARQHKKLGVAFATVAGTFFLIGPDGNGLLHAASDPLVQQVGLWGSKITGAATGILGIAGSYGAINVPQDVGLHTIFIAMGGSLGLVSSGIQRGAVGIKNLVSRPDNNGPQ